MNWEDERCVDAGTRESVLAALYTTDFVPVKQLVLLILQYTLPFRSVVTCVGPDSCDVFRGDATQFSRPAHVCIIRHADGAAGGKSSSSSSSLSPYPYDVVVSDHEDRCFK